MKFSWSLFIIKLILLFLGGMLIGSVTASAGVLFLMWANSINETGN